MDETFYDRFLYHLAQMNYEECYRLIDSSSLERQLDRGFKALVCFDMLYYEIACVTHKDVNRESAVRELSKEVSEAFSEESSSLFEELLALVEVKLQTTALYKALADQDFTLPRSFYDKCMECLGVLEGLQHYDLAPYRETLFFEISAVKHLLVAFKSLSTFDYMYTILSLTQSHCFIQQWEKVFIRKKYSPNNINNSKAEYNFLYKFVLKIQHSLIVKASLYFDETLSLVSNRELLAFGNEYITR